MARKPGKYAHVGLDKLERLPGVEPEKKDIIESVTQDILNTTGPSTSTLTVDDLLNSINGDTKTLIDIETHAVNKQDVTEYGRVYAELRKARDVLKACDSSVNLLLEAYEQLIIKQLEAEGSTAVRLRNDRLISLIYEPYVQVQDKEAFRLWCISQHLEHDMTLHPSKAASICKQMLIAGDAEPPGVKIFSNVKVRLGSE